VCHGWDASHDRHYSLITQEPLLICTILMISAQHCALPGPGGTSRSVLVHQRLWEYCQQLITRLVFGQEKVSANTRTIGTIEALLLITEWHPKAMRLPLVADGWDCELLLNQNSGGDGDKSQPDVVDEYETSWVANIVAPAKMSDQMTWMLLSCAHALGHELNLFPLDKHSESSTIYQLHQKSRRHRISKLLFITIEQLSLKLSRTSLVPASLGSHLREQSLDGLESTFLTAWIELVALRRTINDFLFPSASGTRELLTSGRYLNILKHFNEQLKSWKSKWINEDSEFDHAHATDCYD
jgi:hypothetical protein